MTPIATAPRPHGHAVEDVQGHADTRERVALINRHREEELPTLARLGALIEAKLREAGVDVPYR